MTHTFTQDEAQLPARLCTECDMWPEHHNHRGYGIGECVCQTCMPDAEDLPEDDGVSGDMYRSRPPVNGLPLGGSVEITYADGHFTYAPVTAERGPNADLVIIDEAIVMRDGQMRRVIFDRAAMDRAFRRGDR